MSGQGRGRGESKNVGIIDEVDPRIERDRRAQLEAAAALGIPESDVPVRGRGGFRQVELRTIPENASQLRVENFAGSHQVDLLTNYVPIIPMEKRVIYMYRVDFNPVVESQRRMHFLFRSASRQLFTTPPIYDGVHECRSCQRLPDRVTTTTIQDGQDGVSYEVIFTGTGTSSHGAEFTRNYNTHMKAFLRIMGYYSPQAGLYVSPDHADQVGQDIMMLRGYRTAANMHDGKKMLMNLEGAHKLVQRRSCLQIMQDARQHAPRGSNIQEVIRTILTGKIVVTSYNKRCYRIEDVEFTKRVTDTFDRNGTPTTFREYFSSVHNLQIEDLRQPLLKVVPNNQRNREEVDRVTLLVPELCNLAGLTDQQRNDNRLKMDLIRASQVSPANRVQHLREFLGKFHSTPEIRQQLSNWAYSYGEEPCRLKAHVIAPTGYAYGNICQKTPAQYNKADPNSADIKIFGLADIPAISKMVIMVPSSLMRDKPQMLTVLRGGFSKVGLTPQNVDIKDMSSDSSQSYANHLRALPQDTTVAIVIMKYQNKEQYDAIKKAASIEKGLITQVVTNKLLMDQRKATSAAQKIAIQVAAKVGGEPWWVDIPLKGTMVCGYDTYHDTAKRGRSYGAFVASLNIHYSRWWSKSDAHERLEEISSQMSVNVMEAIKQYKKFNNNQNPEKVIIYRDGVGEGQLEHVYRVELQEIQKALKTLQPAVKLTMVVVNKRIGARFYLSSGTKDSFTNPQPGTVVDHTVTREERFDFYLISQSTRQGTVTPTYYNIIHDEAGFKPEIHQKLAFKMCLLYYNWSGTVRVPAPCQYAHKLALLCGEHLHGQPHTLIEDKLHYL